MFFASDLRASNGIIRTINRVLLPIHPGRRPLKRYLSPDGARVARFLDSKPRHARQAVARTEPVATRQRLAVIRLVYLPVRNRRHRASTENAPAPLMTSNSSKKIQSTR